MRRHKPTEETRKLVQSLAGFGVPYSQIACLVGEGISEKTLYAYYQIDLDLGKAKANSQVGRTLFQKAINGDTAALIFWCKTQMGMKETHVVVGDKNSDAVQVESAITFSLSGTLAELADSMRDAGTTSADEASGAD